MVKTPKKITLAEIGQRINSHLKRFEIEETRRRNAMPREERPELRSYFWAGAHVSGPRVCVSYINYQGPSRLTRDEALHYLKALDDGFEGRHWEWFRKHPPPEPEVQVRFHCIIRDSLGRFRLYPVTKRTEKRVYGLPKEYPRYVERSKVVKMNGTAEMVSALNEVEADRDRRIREFRSQVQAEYKAEVALILGEGE